MGFAFTRQSSLGGMHAVMSFPVPIAFFVYNRPEHTRAVFAEIRRQRPERLLLIADGPRDEHDRAACEHVRRTIEEVDWSCEVRQEYSPVNLGCGRRVSTGLDWVFTHCEAAIILEDDCLPEPTFFRFCAELLEKYQDQPNVMQVCGTNHDVRWVDRKHSYYFVRDTALPWGWATWKRAWRHNDLTVADWPALRETGWPYSVWKDARLAQVEVTKLERVYSGALDTWDFQWRHAIIRNDGLSIVPSSNLITNIGFGEGATHTISDKLGLANLPVVPIRFPLRHPHVVARNVGAENALRRKYHIRRLGVLWYYIQEARFNLARIKRGVLRFLWIPRNVVR